MNIINKSYVSREEAWEIALERDIARLPRSGREIFTVPQTAACKPTLVLGHDKHGYYLAEVI